MAKKPVIPGAKPVGLPPQAKPDAAAKAATRARLVAKGVPLAIATQLAGVGEDLTTAELAKRRIDWQRTLPKAT